MLGHTYRYHIYNSTGVSVTCTVTTRDFKFASDGSRTDGAEVVSVNGVAVATASYSNSATIDNSVAKNLGTDIRFTATPSASATGSVSLFLQRSTDSGATWPSNGQGQLLASMYFNASATAVTTNAVVR